MNWGSWSRGRLRWAEASGDLIKILQRRSRASHTSELTWTEREKTFSTPANLKYAAFACCAMFKMQLGILINPIFHIDELAVVMRCISVSCWMRNQMRYADPNHFNRGHPRIKCAPSFKDFSNEITSWQERCEKIELSRLHWNSLLQTFLFSCWREGQLGTRCRGAIWMRIQQFRIVHISMTVRQLCWAVPVRRISEFHWNSVFCTCKVCKHWTWHVKVFSWKDFCDGETSILHNLNGV